MSPKQSGIGMRRVAPGHLAELRSHTFLLTGIFLNLACHMLDTISKINLWFMAPCICGDPGICQDGEEAVRQRHTGRHL